MNIREARIDDYEGFLSVFKEIEKLHREFVNWKFRECDNEQNIFPYEYYKKMVEKNNSNIYIFEFENKIVGLSMGEIVESKDIPVLKEREYLKIRTVGVLPEYRNKGIGNKLLKELENWAMSKGVYDFEIDVYAFNNSALEFYKNNDFDVYLYGLRKSKN